MCWENSPSYKDQSAVLAVKWVVSQLKTLTRSLWMKLLASRYSIPSQMSWHMDRSHASFRAPPLCRRKFSRQPFSMNSATISRGRCCKQTPYSCTSLGWHSLLGNTTNTRVSLPRLCSLIAACLHLNLSPLLTSWPWPPRWSPPRTWLPLWWPWWPLSAQPSTCRASPDRTDRCPAPSWRSARWGWSPTSLQGGKQKEEEIRGREIQHRKKREKHTWRCFPDNSELKFWPKFNTDKQVT